MQKQRILTIDIMRGLTLFLMLFVNDLYAEGVPAWLTHRPANFDGMGLADWVFPGFLFMVGMAVPFAIQSRIRKGDTTFRLFIHILTRSISLLIIGVLMLNVNRLNAELTGMNKNLWALLVFLCVFLIWNSYKDLKPRTVYLLKAIGVIGLLVLVALFKAGTAGNISWIATSWWGILGLIAWGYLTTSLVYLFVKDNLLGTGLVWLLFVALNILSQLGLLNFLNFVKPIFGVIIGGNIPSIVIAGLFFSLLLRHLKNDYVHFVIIATGVGLTALVAGMVLRHWFIISKILGTPSWAMICNGISILVFVVLFIIIDILGKKRWANIFIPAGQNSLTTYLAPDIIYFSIWLSGVPVLFYKGSGHAFVIIIGSLVWAIFMILFSIELSKLKIRLKL